MVIENKWKAFFRWRCGESDYGRLSIQVERWLRAETWVEMGERERESVCVCVCVPRTEDRKTIVDSGVLEESDLERDN